MQVNGPSAPWLSAGFGQPILRTRRAPSTEAQQADPRARLDTLATILGRLRKGVQELDGATSSGSRAAAGAPQYLLTSQSSLGLDYSETSTTLASTEEVNATPTSYSTHEPAFTGSSSTTPTLTGVYDGSLGDQTLTFRSSTSTIVGTLGFQVQVRDESGATIETLSFGSGSNPTKTTSFGLTLAFDSGLIFAGDTFQVAVSSSVGTAVDPDAAFDGELDDGPEFDPGLGVGAGSFEVNGVAIAVGASDTLNDVLARVSGSAAGVLASFDAASERVLLTSTTPGSSGAIALGADTSGFLEAAKLDGATAATGRDPDHLVPIAQVAALAGIQSGDFTIQGVTLSVDVDVDSLQDVLERISDAVPGLTAEVDTVADLVRLLSSDELELADGTSGLLAALGLEGGEAEELPGLARRGGGSVRRGRFLEGLRHVSLGLERLFGAAFHPSAVGVAEVARKAFTDAIAESLGVSAKALGQGLERSGFGIDFDLSEDAEARLDVDTASVTRALELREDELARWAGGDASDADPGLVGRLSEALELAESALAKRLADSSGVDLLA